MHQTPLLRRVGFQALEFPPSLFSEPVVMQKTLRRGWQVWALSSYMARLFITKRKVRRSPGVKFFLRAVFRPRGAATVQTAELSLLLSPPLAPGCLGRWKLQIETLRVPGSCASWRL